jgi:hypothetical protein
MKEYWAFVESHLDQFLHYWFPNKQPAAYFKPDASNPQMGSYENIVYGRTSYLHLRLVPNNDNKPLEKVDIHDMTITCDTDGYCNVFRHTHYQRKHEPEEIVPFTEYV